MHVCQISSKSFFLSDIRLSPTRYTWAESSPAYVYDQDSILLLLSRSLFCRKAFAVFFRYLPSTVHILLSACILAQTLCGTYNSTLYVLNCHCPSRTHLLFFVWSANPLHCNRSFVLLKAEAAQPHRHSRWLFVPPALPSELMLKLQPKEGVPKGQILDFERHPLFLRNRFIKIKKSPMAPIHSLLPLSLLCCGLSKGASIRLLP